MHNYCYNFFGILTFISLVLIPGISLANQTESEVNDARAFADGPIVFDETLTGGLPGSYGGDSSSPQDYWSFSATSGLSYTFVANPVNATFISPLDLGLEIEDSLGNVVATRDSFGDNQSETLNWNCTASGTYYLVVYEATATPNGIASYTINASEPSAVDDWDLY